MSLVVEIRAIKSEDENGGLSDVLRDLVKTLGTESSKATFNAIESTVCRGILQNNLDISFTNKWDSTVYQGVMSGVSKLASTADTGTWGNWGKAIMAGVDFLNTGLNMGGMSMIGTGAASTKMYGGSNISGLTVSLKWYTPQATKSQYSANKEYEESIKALVVLGFPSQRNASDSVRLNSNKLGEKVGDDTDTKNAITKTIQTLFSINPPPVKLTILSGDKVIHNIYPLVITNITLHSSRETLNGIPIVLGANISFDFYQIRGNGGYIKEKDDEKLKFAGIDLLDKVVASSGLRVSDVVNGDPEKNIATSWKTTDSSGKVKNNQKWEKENQIVVREVTLDDKGQGVPGSVVTYTENKNASSLIPYLTIDNSKENIVRTNINETTTKLDVIDKITNTKNTLMYVKNNDGSYKVTQQTYTEAGISVGKPIDVSTLPNIVIPPPSMPSENGSN